MESNSRLAVKVGIFFTLAMIIVMFLSLQVTDVFLERQYKIVANFEEATGVARGTKVSLRGVPVGTVESIQWDEEQLDVRVTMRIEETYKIPSSATAKIQMGSLLGGSYVSLIVDKESSEGGTFLQEGDVIETSSTLSIDEVMEIFSDISGDAQQLIQNLDENQQETLGEIKNIIDENREEFNKASQSFARLGPKLEKLSDDLTVMAAEVRDGEGTLGRLYSDPTLYNDLRDIADSAKEVSSQIKSGEGTLGQLIYKDDLVTEANKVMMDLQSAADEVQAALGENREGIKEAIKSFSETGPRIERAMEDFRSIAQKINEGEGTLGRLVNDPELYEDARKTVNQVGESFENAEEQGVFRSFLGVVFGALI